MDKEFNLSEKITKCNEIHKIMEEAISTGKTGCMVMTGQSTFLHTSFIEEFIKRLKEEFSNCKINSHKDYTKPYQIFDMCIETIDKLAGKSFTQ